MTSEESGSFYQNNQGWIAFATGVFSGLVFGFLTQDWRFLFFSAIIAGLFAESYRKGLKYGIFTVLTVYVLDLVYLFLTSPMMDVLNVFIGIIGLTGMGWIILLIVLLIALLIGLTGGYFGASIHALINWDEWVWW